MNDERETMGSNKNDPTEPIRVKASLYPAVDEGTSCTQSSFKTAKKAFLYIGMQGGRYKAMFKLQNSLREAAKLASENPDRYQVGSTAWVTARFTADEPMPNKLWEKWLDESYELSVSPGTEKKSATRAKKKSANKKILKKNAPKKKLARKKK